jgi:ketosteroid isomerase-like protein
MAMKPTCLLAIFIFAITGCVQTQTTDGDAAKRTITSLEARWYEAFKAKDTKAIDSILDERVLLVNGDGSMQTKGEFLAALKSMFSQPVAEQQHTTQESLDIKVFGTAAVAIGVMWVEGVVHGKANRHRERFLDTWKYKNGTWLIIGTEATPILH